MTHTQPPQMTSDGSDVEEKMRAEHKEGHEYHQGVLHMNEKQIHREDVKYAEGDERYNTLTTWIVAGFFAFCLFTDSFSLSVTTSQSSFIAADIGGASISSWYGNCALVSSTVAFPVAFYISDNIGRKLMMQIGSVGLFVGALISSRATVPGQMIAGLVIMGLGVGFLATILVGISDVVTVKQRALFLGLLDIGGGLSVLCASIVGGAIVSNTPGSWRNCFYLVAALSAAVFLGSLGFHPQYKREKSIMATLLELDWIGVLIITAAIVLTLVGLSMPFIYPWSAGVVIGPLTSGLVMLVVFCIWCKVKKNAIVKRSLFTFYNYPFAAFLAWLSGFLLYGFAGFLPSMLTLFYGADAIKTGVLLIAANALYVVITPVGSASISFLNGSFKPLLTFGFVSAAIGCGVISTLKPGDSEAKFYGMSIPYAIGNSLISGMSLCVTQYACKHEDLGIAVGVSNATRTFGGALSLAIFNTMLSKRVAIAIPRLVPAALVAAGLPESSIAQMISALLSGSPEAIAAVPGVTEAAAAAGGQAVLESYKYGFEACFWFAAAFMALGACVVPFMHSIKPARLTDEVAVAMGAFGTGKEQNNIKRRKEDIA